MIEAAFNQHGELHLLYMHAKLALKC